MNRSPAPVLAAIETRFGFPNGREVGPVSLSVAAGGLTALLGPNGAGKSTFMRGLIGLTPQIGGSVTIDGAPAPAGTAPKAHARMGVGYAPQGRRVFPGLTTAENLQAVSDDRKPARDARFDEVLALFPRLARRLNVEAWRLSGGEQQMLAIGRAMMRRPRLLLLDEPSLGLAPIAADSLFETIAVIKASGVAVVLAEQSVGRALAVADDVILLAQGRVVRAGAPSAFADDALVRAYLG